MYQALQAINGIFLFFLLISLLLFPHHALKNVKSIFGSMVMQKQPQAMLSSHQNLG
jgi:hypothetical protein